MTLPVNMDSERIVATFTDLLKINSPSFGEQKIGEYLEERLTALGCAVERQEYTESFNLIARLQGSIPDAPPLLLGAHMDTAEPTEGIVFEIENGIIRSDGKTILGADNKCALAQIIEALTILEDGSVPHGDIEIVFTSAEEKGLFGARNLDFSGIRSRCALVLDAGGPVGCIVTASPSRYEYEIIANGIGAHAGIEPEKGLNAVRIAAALILELPDGRLSPETTANVGIINGGTATNIVPDYVSIRGEIRSHDRAVYEALKINLLETAARCSGRFGAGIRSSGHDEYRAYALQNDDPFLVFLDGIYRESGLSPAHIQTGGGSDANIFMEKGINSYNLCPGMHRIHSRGEYISVHDLATMVSLLSRIVAGYANRGIC